MRDGVGRRNMSADRLRGGPGLSQRLAFTEVEVPKAIPKADFVKMLDWAVKFEDGKNIHYVPGGGGAWRIRLHPSHTNAARALLRRVGLDLDITDRVALAGEVTTKGRGRMSVRVKLFPERQLFEVWDNEVPKRVTFYAVETLYGILREKGELPPRAVWWHLADRHRLFPEVGEIKARLRELDERAPASMRGDRLHALSTFLDKATTDLFEGMRRTGKNPDELTYYSLYWYPLLILQRCGLAGESGNRKVFVTKAGRETEDWLPAARLAFQGTLEAAEE